MNCKLLLDTNIVIALFSNDQSVQKGLLEAKEVFVPSIGIIYKNIIFIISLTLLKSLSIVTISSSCSFAILY